MIAETLGFIGIAFVMAAMLQNNMRRLRYLSIVGSAIFMVQAVMMHSYSLVIANAAFIIIHIVWFSKNRIIS